MARRHRRDRQGKQRSGRTRGPARPLQTAPEAEAKATPAGHGAQAANGAETLSMGPPFLTGWALGSVVVSPFAIFLLSQKPVTSFLAEEMPEVTLRQESIIGVGLGIGLFAGAVFGYFFARRAVRESVQSVSRR